MHALRKISPRGGFLMLAVALLLGSAVWKLPADGHALADGPAESKVQLADARQQRMEMIQELRAINTRLSEIAALLKESRPERGPAPKGG
ncbi:hypothetical protein RAS1_33090 [Phycisphaerae bacterium RAS1]|nr:hypothetical protein RAS1_33090 [Phycisphaerae bacterium RAS1]